MKRFLVTLQARGKIRTDAVEAETAPEAAEQVSSARGDAPGSSYAVEADDGSELLQEIRIG
jgi:hypothetical protein